VTGYSTNDTIVIFDRVRENMRKMRRDSSAR
jgi:preprotein translocase subunit SecF